MTEISPSFEINQINSVISTESVDSSFETSEINSTIESVHLTAEFHNNELTITFEKSIVINSFETNYVQDVVDVSEIDVVHGLGKFVDPIFIDVNNTYWDTSVKHINMNTIRCFFTPNYSGKIICK